MEDVVVEFEGSTVKVYIGRWRYPAIVEHGVTPERLKEYLEAEGADYAETEDGRLIVAHDQLDRVERAFWRLKRYERGEA